MGLRCLFGHDFTEPELERDRETSGGEVVITVREVKTCRRCGETQIVSENKEVTSVEQLAETARGIEREDDSSESPHEPTTEAVEEAESGAGETDVSGSSPDSHAEAPPEAPGEPAAEDVEMGERAGGELDEEADVEPDDGFPVDAAEERDVDEDTELEDDEVPKDAEEDDGIILDDGPAKPDRTPSAWPDASDTREADEESTPEGAEPAAGDESAAVDEIDEADAEPWPDQHGEDEGYDAEPGGGTPEGVSFESGLRPEATDGRSPEDDEGVEFIESSGDVPDSGGRWPDPTDVPDEDDAEGPTVDADDGPAVDADDGSEAGADATGTNTPQDTEFTRAADAVDTSKGTPFETEFFCPECGHSAPAEGSSLRTGDICPECRRGYIAERERAPER